MCHDLGNPLKGTVDMLRSLINLGVNVKPRHLELIQNSLEESWKVLKMVNTMREKNTFDEFSLESYFLEDLVEDSIDSVSPQLELKQIEVVIEPLPKVKLLVERSSFCHSVLGNILSNALKYSEDNSKVFISVECLDGFIHIYVRDNGCGISSDDLNRISNHMNPTVQPGVNGK